MVPLSIPELASCEIFLILGFQVAIIFAQSWNFELKFFMKDPFMQKIISTGVGSNFLPKKCLEGPKTQIQKLF